MKAVEEHRSHAPFEALLAASGNLDGTQASGCSSKARAGQIKRSYSSADLSELDSADNTALGGAYAEGVGESGETESQSESSRDNQGSEGTKGGGSESKSAREGAQSSRSGSANAKKMRMVWTIELHKRFLNAVNHLGMDNAVPKVILKMMNVDGMTRENVASHLQKYRLHLKHQASGQGPRNVGMQSAEGSFPGAQLGNPAAKGMPVTHAGSMTAGLQPIPGSTALGLPLSAPLAAYQMAGSLLTGAPCEHIPPQAWAAGVPGYDALQKLERIPEEQKAALLKDLTAPRTMAEDFNTRRSRPQRFQTPTLDIAPLETTPPKSMPAKPGYTGD